jgi:hypothetical protein
LDRRGEAGGEAIKDKVRPDKYDWKLLCVKLRDALAGYVSHSNSQEAYREATNVLAEYDELRRLDRGWVNPIGSADMDSMSGLEIRPESRP